jgi:hypothetical protein
VASTSSPIVCALCGTAAPADPPPLSWSVSQQDGVRQWTCERCARDNIRSIEGRLDQHWW